VSADHALQTGGLADGGSVRQRRGSRQFRRTHGGHVRGRAGEGRAQVLDGALGVRASVRTRVARSGEQSYTAQLEAQTSNKNSNSHQMSHSS
jgi:hypothetical protein